MHGSALSVRRERFFSSGGTYGWMNGRIHPNCSMLNRKNYIEKYFANNVGQKCINMTSFFCSSSGIETTDTLKYNLMQL
jgi:hypothetical protein